jgi:hypothetical protein
VNQDPVDDVLILNASDDFDGSTAATANLDVDIESIGSINTPSFHNLLATSYYK